jgi:hypothetical protein
MELGEHPAGYYINDDMAVRDISNIIIAHRIVLSP